MVLSLLLLTHVLCVRGTFALFNNLWDPNNAIHVRSLVLARARLYLLVSRLVVRVVG